MAKIQRFLNRVMAWVERLAGRSIACWAITSLTFLGFVCLTEIGALLNEVEAPGNVSFSPGVFTGPRFDPLSTEQLESAVRLWRSVERPPSTGSAAEARSEPIAVARMLRWHFLIDFCFIAAYTSLLAFLLRATARTETTPAKRANWWFTIPLGVFVLDYLETGWTAIALWNLDPPTWMLHVIPFLSDLKWAYLGAAVLLLLVQVISRCREGCGGLRPAVRLAWIIALVALFTVFVAFPGDGTFNQVPDVLRYQLFEIYEWRGRAIIAAALAIVQLPFVVAFGARLALGRPSPKAEIRSLWILIGALAVAGVIGALQWWVDGSADGFTWLAPFLIVAAIAIAGWFMDRVEVGFEARPVVPRPAAALSEAELRWVSGLAGATAVVTGIGLVRAVLPELVLADGRDDLPWIIPGVLGLAIVAVGGWVYQLVVRKANRDAPPAPDQAVRARVSAFGKSAIHPTSPEFWRNGYQVGLVISATMFALIALSLLRWPEEARRLGTTGVIAIGVGTYAMVLGGAPWVGRLLRPWGAARRIGLGRESPPVLGIVVAIWVLASVLNRSGGYHDARLAAGTNEASKHASLSDAFTTWNVAQENNSGCTMLRTVRPMVFVAVPGGGGKAAYWSAASLDALFEDPCARSSVFAVSGISGGSVGATAWLAAGPNAIAEPAVREMTRDDALAAAFAGVFFRDIPQPLLGIRTGWRDRAALMEDRWLRTNPALGTKSKPRTIDGLDASGAPWTPVVVLNASSVTDGCRILIANTSGLAAANGPNCYETTAGGDQLDGFVSGAIDGTNGLSAGIRDGGGGCDDSRDVAMPAVTAALLSARFPGISPSGALYHCLPARDPATGIERTVRRTSYAVDGGYTEGSGILTALQLWIGVQGQVREHNRENAVCIEPWLVVLSSSYQSTASVSSNERPYELLVPIAALSANEVLSQATLEQTAAAIFDTRSVPCGAPETEAPPPTSQPAEPDAAYGSPETEAAHVVHLGLSRKPEVSAPLGWVLSERSTKNMCRQLQARILQGENSPGTPLYDFLAVLGHNPDAQESCGR